MLQEQATANGEKEGESFYLVHLVSFLLNIYKNYTADRMKTDLSSLTFKRKIQRKVSRQCKKDH